jgi:hypothetical protein
MQNPFQPKKQTPIEWLKDRRNRPTIVVGGLGFIMVVVFVALTQMPSGSRPASTAQPATETRPSGDDEGAKREIKKLDWVKDVYISPGHMNIGVIRTEKRWDSPMIGNSICGILRRFGSNITRVRFVDIEQVAYEQKPPNQAEIYLFNCS